MSRWILFVFFFSSRRRHTRCSRDWSSDVCSSDLFLGAFAGEDLVGYACWGPTPGTTGTYDLYWIVVDPAWQGKRVGTQLLASVEAQLATDHGRLIVVETSSRADYGPTRAFYERRGYARAALIPGYYAAGDDLVIYLKDLTHGVVARATA